MRGHSGKKIARKSRHSCIVNSRSCGCIGTVDSDPKCAHSWNQIQTLEYYLFCHIYCVHLWTRVCIALFYETNIGKSLRSRGHSLRQGTWNSWILTLHLDYVAGYTSPLLFLFERTHNYSVDNQRFIPWRLLRLVRSQVCSVSLVRVLSDGKIS